MTDNYEERLARKKAEEEALRKQLADCAFDGPYEFNTAGGLFEGLGVLNKEFTYAICDICGAMVRLDDPIEINGMKIERGILRHTAFHGPKNTEETDN